MTKAYLLCGARTPIGRISGTLAGLNATSLGAVAITAALERGGVQPDEVGAVVMGHVLQAGQGQNTARQAAVGAGVPMSVPASTVNKVCLSGLYAIYVAALMVRTGEADIVVAGGMESMSRAPHIVDGARAGLGLGGGALQDAITADGLRCAFTGLSMGELTEADARAEGITRQAQDAFAVRSHNSALAGAARLSQEIVEVKAPVRRGASLVVTSDEGPRPTTTMEVLASLRPAFVDDGGAITAGNASQLSDGAAAVVVASEKAVERLGRQPLAEMVSFGQVAGPGPSLLGQPARAVRAASAKAGLEVNDLDVFELN
jgi:acetyl-CoA C-acetyltransferase